jgi:hypothetical protein
MFNLCISNFAALASRTRTVLSSDSAVSRGMRSANTVGNTVANSGRTGKSEIEQMAASKNSWNRQNPILYFKTHT